MNMPEEATSDTSPVTEPEMEQTVAVYAARDAVTAEVVRGMLAAEGITAIIGEQVTDALGGAFAVGEGFWGEVRVPGSEEEVARSLLQSYENGQGDNAAAEELNRAAESSFDPQV